MKPSSQPVNSLDPLLYIPSQIGSLLTLRPPKTLKSFSVIPTGRHPLQRKAIFIYSPLVYIGNMMVWVGLHSGSLGNSRVISEEYVKWLKGYCEAFFYGLTVKFLEPVSISATKCSFRVNDHTQNLQIHAGHILTFLKKKKPEDAFCVVGITMIDLYPRDSWNFVFGQASLTEGVGIFSFARYGKDFHSSCYKGTVTKAKRTSSSEYSIFDNYYIPEITSVLLLRSCKTLTHEIGHIFGLRHCQWLACLMQGSNHLEEADRRPLNLCPICLRKLQCALGFDVVERYKALLRWLDDECKDTPRATPEHSYEDLNLTKPVEAFQEWKEWILKCLAVLQKEGP
uniref:archaemetzincin-2 isoform X3 n=1 Tax=Jaculus jaculus TaxID=51337 RepID=UPI001E1B3420|nr:archaemetzincin-2 isoform X3 [Jaculus jaculus]